MPDDRAPFDQVRVSDDPAALLPLAGGLRRLHGERIRQIIRQYIAGQEEHHRHKTFREELIGFLRKSGIEFDERYLD